MLWGIYLCILTLSLSKKIFTLLQKKIKSESEKYSLEGDIKVEKIKVMYLLIPFKRVFAVGPLA